MKKFVKTNFNDPVTAEDQSILAINGCFRKKKENIQSGGCESCDDSGAGCDDCGGPTGG